MNRNMTMKIKNRLRAVTSAAGRDAQIPVFDTFRLEMGEDENIRLCGCRGILTYSGEVITLLTDRFTVTVKGSGLCIKKFSEVSATVGGRIESVGFGRTEV